MFEALSVHGVQSTQQSRADQGLEFYTLIGSIMGYPYAIRIRQKARNISPRGVSCFVPKPLVGVLGLRVPLAVSLWDTGGVMSV